MRLINIFQNRLNWLIMIFYWIMAISVMRVSPQWGAAAFAVAGGTTLVLSYKTNIIPSLFLLSIMTTSFFSLEIAGSHFKLPFLLSVLVLPYVGFGNILKALNSNVVRFIACYILFTLGVTLFTTQDLADSLRIAALPFLFLLISVSVSSLLLSGRISLDYAVKIVIFAGIVNMVIGILQYVGYFGVGIDLLNFTQIQWEQISLHHRMTATFWEGDTYGKYLMVFILLLSPLAVYLSKQKNKILLYIILIAVLSLFVNQTRTALVGLSVGLMLFILFFPISLARRALYVFFLLIGLSMSYLTISYFQRDTFNIERWQNLTSVDKMRQDGSGYFRFKTIEDAWAIMHQDSLTPVVGTGFINRGEDWGGVSNIFVQIGLSSGYVGIFFFVLGLFFFFRYCIKHKAALPETKYIAQGAVLSMTGMLVSSQMAPMHGTTLFWMVIGFGIYFDKTRDSLLTREMKRSR